MIRQQGMALFFAMLVLALITVIGISLMFTSTLSLKMAGSGVERLEALTLARGLQAQFIRDHESSFVDLIEQITIVDLASNTVHSALPLAQLDTSCRSHSDNTSQELSLQCKQLEVSTAVSFGRNNLGILTVVSGVELQLVNQTEESCVSDEADCELTTIAVNRTYYYIAE